MEYARLENTDLIISCIGFGCEPLGGTDWGEVDEQQAIAAVHKALHLGVNFFDTADVYGLGRSEELLSKALGASRHEVVIASKVGVNWHVPPAGGRARTFLDSSRRRVVEALEGSLRRLRIDCLPLYLVHWPDPHTPLAETLEALLRCREAGKIKYIGVSNFPLQLIQEARQILDLAVVELQYSIIHRQIEWELLPYCQACKIGVLVYGPLSQGLLTGKYGSDAYFAANDRRSRLTYFQGQHLAENLKIVRRIGRVGKSYGKLPSQVAIRWVLENPAISCAITGAKSPAQIEENVGALGWHLSQKDRQYIVQGHCL
jgi:aryl-alcohol dehydrogenase-like predicted oxidoreductase